MSNFYILDGKTPVPVDNAIEWAKGFNETRVVKQTTLPDGTFISTVFLGFDHAFFETEKPRIFETMIFGGEHDQFTERYSTWDEAEKGHENAIELIHQP